MLKYILLFGLMALIAAVPIPAQAQIVDTCTTFPAHRDPIQPDNIDRLHGTGLVSRGIIQQVKWSPDGQYFVVASSIGLWVYKTDDLNQPFYFLENQAAVAFSPDSRLIASIDYLSSGQIRLWDTATGKLQRVLEGSESWYTSLLFSPDGKLLVAGPINQDGAVNVRSVESGKLLATLLSGFSKQANTSPDMRDHQRTPPYQVLFTPDSQRLYFLGWDFKVHVWNAVTSQFQMVGDEKGIHATGFNIVYPTLVVVNTLGFSNNPVVVWNLRTNIPYTIPIVEKAGTLVNFVSTLDKTGSIFARIVSDNNGNELQIWDLKHVQQSQSVRIPFERIDSLTFSLDGERLYVLGDNHFWSWNRADNSLASSVIDNSDQGYRLSQTTSLLMRITTATPDKPVVVHLINIHDQTTWDFNTQIYYPLLFIPLDISPNGHLLALNGSNEIQILDLCSGQSLGVLGV